MTQKRLTDVTINKPFPNDAPIPQNGIDTLKQIPPSDPESKTCYGYILRRQLIN